MKKNRIAIDVSPLNDGNSQRGVGYYTRNLVAALQKEVKTNPNYKNYEIILVTDNSKLVTSFDLIHYPYFDSFKLTLPRAKHIPYIVTCHDLIPRTFRKNFPVGLKGEIKWLIQKHRLEQARSIICPTEAAKLQILEQISYPKNRLFVTYEAANSNFKKITDKKLLQSIKNKYQLPDKFVLFVGDINWNKNIPTLVKACLQLKYPLVIAGGAAVKKVPLHPWTEDIHWLQSEALKHQSSKALNLLGFVPDEDLPPLYNLATLYCQPSYGEGFGLPLVEAMKSGTPLCVSNTSCLPEIASQAALYFDPYSQKSIASTLKKVWQSSSLRESMSQKGLLRSNFFSWENTAKNTLAVYDLALLHEKK